VTIQTWIDLVYLLAAVGFIVALKGLSSPKQARNGNLLGAAAATLAVGFTFADPAVRAHGLNLGLTLVAMVIGASIAVPAARMVKMTAMPQMVAIFNGVGGGAAALISIVAFVIDQPGKPALYRIAEVLFGVLVGCVSFAGSAIAFAKLQELMPGRPVTYPGQQAINAVVGATILGLIVATLATDSIPLLAITAVLSLVLGAIFTLPIGGADMQRASRMFAPDSLNTRERSSSRRWRSHASICISTTNAVDWSPSQETLVKRSGSLRSSATLGQSSRWIVIPRPSEM